MTESNPVTIEEISDKIYNIRGVKVMLDMDLAQLYEVETRILKRNVRRHIDRFPDDFMFELTKKELSNLRSQYGTSSWRGILIHQDWVTLICSKKVF